MPVLDAAQFLRDIHEGTYLRTKLLVLWSMFFAAASVSLQAKLGDEEEKILTRTSSLTLV